MALDPIILDYVAFVLFLGLSIGYHVFYVVVMRHHPAWSHKARMHHHRLSWIESVQRRGERIMAVQALRNLIMTNTFLASTMILLVAFITNFIVVSPPGPPFTHPEPSLVSGAMPYSIKGIVLLVLYGFAFVMFLTSLRNLNHLTILVGVDSENLRLIEGRDPIKFMAQKLNQVESMTTYGRRAVYFSVPVFLWFFSPWLFAAATIAFWTFFVAFLDFVQPFARPAGEAKGEAAKESKPATGVTSPK